MKSKDNKLKISEHLLWDTSIKDYDADKYPRLIIERVLTRGSLEDWYAIRDYYGMDKIKEEVIQIRSLDPITLNFCSVIFEIPIEKFRSNETVRTNPFFKMYYE